MALTTSSSWSAGACGGAVAGRAEAGRAEAGRAEVYLDGGVRRGIDVFIALWLGADAGFIGRPAVYAMAAAGPGRGAQGHHPAHR